MKLDSLPATVDWTLPAQHVVRTVQEATLKGRPLQTYCASFRVELLAAEVLNERWYGTQPGTIVDHLDDGAFTVVCGDGGGVRILSSLTEFHVNRAPVLWTVVLAAGIETPVVLGGTPAAPPFKPYWSRSITAWKTRSLRTLILHLGGAAEDAVSAASQSRSAGGEPVVVDLSGEGDVEAKYPWLEVSPIHRYAGSKAVRTARERAAEWMEGVPFARLSMSSRSFLGTFQDDGVPTWWRFEISLQEPTFLAVRLVETLREAIRLERPGAAILSGTAAAGWVETLVANTCRVERLRVTRPPASPAPSRVEDRLRHRRRWRSVPTIGPAAMRFLSALLTKSAALLAGPFVLLADGFARLLSGLLRLPERMARWALAKPGNLQGGPLPSRAATRVTAAGLLLAALAGLLLVVALWWSPAATLIVLLGCLLALWLVFAALVIAAPTEESAGETAHWASARMRGLTSHVRPRGLARLLMRLVPSRRPGALADGRARIAILVDEGNLRRRRQVSHPVSRWYIPYLEGVVEAFKSLPGVAVSVISYGDPVVSKGALDQLMGLWRRLRPGGAIPLRSEIRAEDSELAAARSDIQRQQASLLENDAGFRAALRYEGVDIWPALADAIREGFAESAHSLAYEAGLGRTLDQIHPDLVVTYNFEGVFRRLLPAMVKRGIPVLGVQQAMGPYVHALAHARAGYDRARDRVSRGVPMPDRVAIWGERDRQQLRTYEQAAETLVLTGYPRTDTFIRERGRISRNRILKRLRLPPASRVVMYTAVLRVLGGPLLPAGQWRGALAALCALARRNPGLHILVKPWPGDDLERVRSLLDEVADEKVRYVDPAIDIHNSELLQVTEAVVGTFSSLLGEALLAGAVPVLLDFPETRYYFGDEVDRYQKLAIKVSSLRAIAPAVQTVLDGGDAFRRTFLENAQPELAHLFGPLDGRAAERVAAAGLDLLETYRRYTVSAPQTAPAGSSGTRPVA